MRNLATALLLILVVSGCGAKDPVMQPVTTFSLGSAKFTPFKKRPTAKELYATVLKLYDSFDTVSASYEDYSLRVGGWAVQDGMAVDIKANKDSSRIEFRYKRPGKSRMLIDGKDPFGPDIQPKERQPIAVWLELGPVFRPEWSRPIDRISLLDDSTVNGSSVYVLELHLPYIAYKRRSGSNEPETRRFYLGKADLLPRKIEVVEKRTGMYSDAKGLPSNTRLRTFTGFVVNRPLPESLFIGPIKLPGGK